MSDESAKQPVADKGDKSTWCYAKHKPGSEPGDPGYCSGSCNRGPVHGDTDHCCTACGQYF